MPSREDTLAIRVRDAAVRFCKQHLGRGPRETRVFVFNDQVLIVARGLLSPIERDLADADPSGSTTRLLKELFWRRVEHGRPRLKVLIAEALGVAVCSVHADLSTNNGDAVLVLGLEGTTLPKAACEATGT